MYRKILVPLDGSELAEGVLPWVSSLVACTRAEVTLLRVVTYPHYDYLLADPGLVVALRETLEAEAKEYIERAAAELAASGVSVKTAVCLATGAVADTIIDYAESAGIHLIAMSTHGRTGPARWFLGSVADRVVRGAGCPVLMYRPLGSH
jgi:nucleotide-binding universal stress UspA family protein